MNISTDALFGLENADYDQMAAKKAEEILRECKTDLDVKAGALRACERSLIGGNNALETIEICDWALNVIKALAVREDMWPYCQGFVK